MQLPLPLQWKSSAIPEFLVILPHSLAFLLLKICSIYSHLFSAEGKRLLTPSTHNGTHISKIRWKGRTRWNARTAQQKLEGAVRNGLSVQQCWEGVIWCVLWQSWNPYAGEKKDDVIKRALQLCGYFFIVTFDKMTAAEAIDLYYSRDASEKLFRGAIFSRYHLSLHTIVNDGGWHRYIQSSEITRI